MTDEILEVKQISKDFGDYCCICPHCGVIVSLGGDDLSELYGEQFQHRIWKTYGCGGWFEISHSAFYVKGL